MRTKSIFETSGNVRKAPRRFSKSTAVEIFDKEYVYPYEVDQVHFKMANGTYKLPMAVSGTSKDHRQQQIALIPTLGTIISMSDYYRDGAVISIKSGEVAKTVYKTILRHMEAHLNAMQTDFHYIAPTDDTLRELAEFATAIHYKALEADANIDKSGQPSSFFDLISTARPYIVIDKDTAKTSAALAVPKSITKMDAIERYLESMGG